MKKAWLILAVLAVMAVVLLVYWKLIAPSYVGKSGSEGNILKDYIDPAALKKLTEDPQSDIWIIDVRPGGAYNQGHIPTARSFPSGTIMERLSELPQDKYLIIYCETGGRANAVAGKLAKQGYTRYINWGGVSRWPYELTADVPL